MNQNVCVQMINYLETHGEHDSAKKMYILFPDLVQYFHDVSELMYVRQKLTEMLSYDPGIYDEYTYARRILKSNIHHELNAYQHIQVPAIVFQGVRRVVEKPIPLSVQLLYDMYFNDPDVRIKIFPLGFYRKLSVKNSNIIRDVIIKNSSFENLMTFTPLCYTIKHDIRMKKTTHVNCLCYMDVIASHKYTSNYVVFTYEMPSVTTAEAQENKILEVVHCATLKYRNTDMDLQIVDLIQGFTKVFKEYSKNL